VSSFLTAHQHILSHLVPYDGVEDLTKEDLRYNQGCLAVRERVTNKTIESKHESENDKNVKKKDKNVRL